MDIIITAAIYLINLGKYETAVEYLKKAIAAEEGKGSMDVAIEYTCILGELLANMGESDKARKEFDKVVEYCSRTNSLEKQRKVAQDFLVEYDRKQKEEYAKRLEVEIREKPAVSELKTNTTQTSIFLQ